jgi:hypothetical protein
MPFKSKAQRRKFAELMVKGEISPETFEEWNRDTGASKLPERVTQKKPKKRSASARKKAGASKRPKKRTTAKKTTARKRKTAARPRKRTNARKSARKSVGKK